MTDTTISDALVFPQDDGTGIPDGNEDFLSAGYLGLLSEHLGGSYVSNGISFTNVDTTNEQVDLTAGHAFITEAGTQVQDTTGTYTTTLPSGSDAVYVVILPSAVTNLGLGADTGNDLWLAVDSTTSNDVYVRHGSGLSAPTDPSVKLGTVDSATGATTRANDGPVYTGRKVHTTHYVGTGGYDTIQAAHDAAADTDRVYILPSYNEANETFPVTVSKKVTIQMDGLNEIANPGTSNTFEIDHGGTNIYPGAKFINVNVGEGGHGFVVRDARYITFINCRADNCANDGFRIGQDGTTATITCYFDNCMARRCGGDGWNFGPETHAISMVNCTTEKNAGRGCDLDSAAAFSIYGSVFQLNDGYGLILDLVDGGVVSGCYFEDNSDATHGNVAEILVDNCDSIAIEGCYFQGFNNNQYAIATNSSGGGSGVSLRSCFFRNYTSAAFQHNNGTDFDIHRMTHTLDSVPTLLNDGGTRTRSNGVIVPQDLSTVTGQYDGDQAIDDGTNTTSTRPELAVWDATNSVWYTQGGDTI